MPYISTSRPDPRVTSANVPSWRLRYSAGYDFAPGCPGQFIELTNSRSCQPSPSASNTTTPAPRVSGRYFLPKAPLLWTNRTPDWAVTSVKTAVGADCPATTAAPRTQHDDTIQANRLIRLKSPQSPGSPKRRRRKGGRLRAEGDSLMPVFVDRLPFVVVVRRFETIRPGDRLRRFVGLESLVERLFPRGKLGLP